ncbi:MAG: drug/metabolite transporter (DMT)-like permease [Gammaproteobacteria bacterium]
MIIRAPNVCRYFVLCPLNEKVNFDFVGRTTERVLLKTLDFLEDVFFEISFAANSVFAALAYAGGSNAMSVLVVRSSVAFVVLEQFALPDSAAGWVGFIAAPLCYTFAIIFLVVVLAKVGSLKTALLMNLEPVSSVLLGYVILSQALNPMQLLGVGLVVGAVVSTETFAHKPVRTVNP